MKLYYLKKADENLPALRTKIVSHEIDSTVMQSGDSIVIDLGNHYVGYFSFKMWYVDIYIDAPVTMSVRFCETKRELDDDYSDYHGVLCKSWLQEEIINVDFPGRYEMPRRYAARYIKICIINSPQKLSLSDFIFKSVSSADENSIAEFDISDKELKRIDEISVNTLKNCMQRVFEDGPKRDRRLWIGDLRLEALTNYYTFKNYELVKRCLYLFAASDRNSFGFMPGYLYENPIFVSGYWFIEDYNLMYVCSLCDYYMHTMDQETFNDLYPAAKSIMDSMENILDDAGIVTTRGGSAFVDWCPGLNKITSLQGIYLYTLELWVNVLKMLSDNDVHIYTQRLNRGRKVALEYLYDASKNSFVNKADDYQYSVHSTAWMILGGVITGEKAKDALYKAINSPDSIKPFTPYMHHYLVEAFVKIGEMNAAEQHIRKIWGGMAKLGFDTFSELYVPDDLDFSAYGDRKINSMCHAWSCTPSYFIRKYGLQINKI